MAIEPQTIDRRPEACRLVLPFALGRPLPPGRHPLGHDRLHLQPPVPGAFGYRPPTRWSRLRQFIARQLQAGK